MSISASKEAFQSLLRIGSSSVADPPWFAAPVDVEEEPDAVIVTFHVPESKYPRVRVRASKQSLVVRSGGRRNRGRAMRYCALPWPVVGGRLQTLRMGDLLRVRIPKKERRDVGPRFGMPSPST